jgi:hypothetical protein
MWAMNGGYGPNPCESSVNIFAYSVGTFPSANAPTASISGSTGLSTGSMYYNTTSGSMYVWNGSTWLDLNGTSGSFTGSFTGSHTGSYTGSFTGSLNGSASFATTSSYVSSIKSGDIRFNQWTADLIGEYTSSVTFTTAYSNNSYAVTVTCGSDIRTLTIISKSSTGFTVSSNSTTPMTDSIYWMCVPYNNP